MTFTMKPSSPAPLAFLLHSVLAAALAGCSPALEAPRHTIVVEARYPGANARVVADTIAAPIEQQINGVENMLTMRSRERRRDLSHHGHLCARRRLGTGPDTCPEPHQPRIAGITGRRSARGSRGQEGSRGRRLDPLPFLTGRPIRSNLSEQLRENSGEG